MGERKQAFSEWIQQKKKQDDDERKRKDRQIKEEFFMMLRDHKDINTKLTWRKAQVKMSLILLYMFFLSNCIYLSIVCSR